MSSVERKTIIPRALWDHSPLFATRAASRLIVDAASRHTPTTPDQAKQGIAEVIGYALSAPSCVEQDVSMKNFVATVSGNQALKGFGSRVNAAWRDLSVTRNLCSDSSAASAARLSPQTVEALLAGARATFDQAVAGHVDEVVRNLAALPRNADLDASPSAAGGSSVVSMREWVAANGRRSDRR